MSMISLQLDENNIDMLRRISNIEDRSMSYIVRKAIKEYIEKYYVQTEKNTI